MTLVYPRPGWGFRRDDFDQLLTTVSPVASRVERWGADGQLPLRASAHLGLIELPDELVTSVRCIVQVGEAVVVCSNADGSHPWPGGRREPGETFAETACREVHEETGWIVDAASLRPLGWLHFEYLTELDEAWPYPHPDFLQVIFTGVASQRDGGPGVDWTDREGWEQSSRLVPRSEVDDVLDDDFVRPFLQHL